MDTSNVQVVYPTATTASTQKPPLLALELQVSDGTMITCKTDLDSIVPRMLAIFDKAISATQVVIHGGLLFSIHSLAHSCLRKVVCGMYCCLLLHVLDVRCWSASYMRRLGILQAIPA